jgi:hypothetical protein
MTTTKDLAGYIGKLGTVKLWTNHNNAKGSNPIGVRVKCVNTRSNWGTAHALVTALDGDGTEAWLQADKVTWDCRFESTDTVEGVQAALEAQKGA